MAVNADRGGVQNQEKLENVILEHSLICNTRHKEEANLGAAPHHKNGENEGTNFCTN